MAKASRSAAKEAKKVSFGKRRKGKAKKTYNKHDRSERNYRGQGR